MEDGVEDGVFVGVEGQLVVGVVGGLSKHLTTGFIISCLSMTPVSPRYLERHSPPITMREANLEGSLFSPVDTSLFLRLLCVDEKGSGVIAMQEAECPTSKQFKVLPSRVVTLQTPSADNETNPD